MTVLVALMTGCDPQTGTDAGNGGGTGNNTPSGSGNGGATGTAAAELVSMDIADAESIYISTPTEAGETVSAKAGVLRNYRVLQPDHPTDDCVSD